MKHTRDETIVPDTRSKPTGPKRRLLDEESFHNVISIERKRAERSRHAFLLMLLDLGRLQAGQQNGNGQGLQKILRALSTSVRETDVIGWHTNHTVLGIIFTDLALESRKSIAGTMLSRVSGLLYNGLTFDEFNQITISYYVFPEDWDYHVAERPSHPTLYPDLEKRDVKSKVYSATKRALDIVGSACGLLLLSPVLLAIAIAIKLSSKGPVLFRQQRVGQFGTPFVFLKFRSMYVNNDNKIHRDYLMDFISGKAERQPSNGNGNGNGHGVYKLTKDRRVTRIGSFLRKSSLDELPQLYNVLHGDMSLVGPRPAIPYEVEAYQLWHRRRVLEAKPGITGLWQVSGRSRVGFDDMVRLDVRYAMERSFWLDLKILLMTPQAVLQGEGAY